MEQEAASIKPKLSSSSKVQPKSNTSKKACKGSREGHLPQRALTLMRIGSTDHSLLPRDELILSVYVVTIWVVILTLKVYSLRLTRWGIGGVGQTI